MFIKRSWTQGLIGILIVGFWVVMMVSLLLREGVLFPPSVETITYKSIFKERLPFHEDWVGIYFQDRKVGYASSIVSPHQKEDVLGLLIRYHGVLSPLAGQRESRFEIQGFSFIDSGYHLRELYFNLASALYQARIYARRVGENLHIDAKLQDIEFKEILPFSECGSISAVVPIFGLPRLKEGRAYAIEFFDPLKMKTNRAELRVKGRERITSRGDSVEAIVAEIFYEQIPITLWVDEDGKVLKLTTSIGWMFLKEDEEEAKEGVL